jgi:prepilin-type N-terminal cleavage/methylation domain-containing protein
MLEKNRGKGFSLIEVLFVISIIGILAAIAIPVYQTKVISARLIEVTNAMGYIATSLVAYRRDGSTNDWPDCGSVADIQTSLGLSLPLRRISSASVNQATGVISVTVRNINSTVDTRTITLAPSIAADASIYWNWGGTLPPKYIPKN